MCTYKMHVSTRIQLDVKSIIKINCYQPFHQRSLASWTNYNHHEPFTKCRIHCHLSVAYEITNNWHISMINRITIVNQYIVIMCIHTIHVYTHVCVAIIIKHRFPVQTILPMAITNHQSGKPLAVNGGITGTTKRLPRQVEVWRASPPLAPSFQNRYPGSCGQEIREWFGWEWGSITVNGG